MDLYGIYDTEFYKLIENKQVIGGKYEYIIDLLEKAGLLDRIISPVYQYLFREIQKFSDTPKKITRGIPNRAYVEPYKTYVDTVRNLPFEKYGYPRDFVVEIKRVCRIYLRIRKIENTSSKTFGENTSPKTFGENTYFSNKNSKITGGIIIDYNKDLPIFKKIFQYSIESKYVLCYKSKVKEGLLTNFITLKTPLIHITQIFTIVFACIKRLGIIVPRDLRFMIVMTYLR